MRHLARLPPARRALLAGLVVALALTGCGQPASDGPTVGPSDGTGTQAPTATGSTGTPAPTTDPMQTDATATEPGTSAPNGTGAVPEDFLAPSEVAESDADGQVDLVVADVRVGAHDGFDRVVFDLTGSGTVGWRVAYDEDPRLDGSGAPVALAGRHTLVVIVRGTGMPEPDETAYDPPQRLVPGTGLSTVTEVLRTTPFEGQVLAYIGTRDEAPFRVLRLTDPERLVVDVARL